MTALIIFILGTCIGSFISLLIERIYKAEPGIFLGRSHCPTCRKVLSATHLIPIISYFVLKGRCAFCKKTISSLYPIIEMTSGFMFTLLYLFNPYPFSGVYIQTFIGIMFFVFIFTFFYDLKFMLVSDRILIPAIGIALLTPFLPHHFLTPMQSLLGLLIPTIFFLVQIFISNGRWLGGGDLRIGALMGAFLGPSNVVVALFAAYVSGAIISILLLTCTKMTRKSMIPFGPFLMFGTVLSFFLGDDIVAMYLQFFSI